MKNKRIARSDEKQNPPIGTILNHSTPCPAARTCDGIAWVPRGYLSPLPPALPSATHGLSLGPAILHACRFLSSVDVPQSWHLQHAGVATWVLPSQFHTMEPHGRDSSPATHCLALTAPWCIPPRPTYLLLIFRTSKNSTR